MYNSEFPYITPTVHIKSNIKNIPFLFLILSATATPSF